MVVFGGGNEGIVDELHVFNTGKCLGVGSLTLDHNGGLGRCCSFVYFISLRFRLSINVNLLNLVRFLPIEPFL